MFGGPLRVGRGGSGKGDGGQTTKSLRCCNTLFSEGVSPEGIVPPKGIVRCLGGLPREGWWEQNQKTKQRPLLASPCPSHLPLGYNRPPFQATWSELTLLPLPGDAYGGEGSAARLQAPERRGQLWRWEGRGSWAEQQGAWRRRGPDGQAPAGPEHLRGSGWPGAPGPLHVSSLGGRRRRTKVWNR